MSGFSSCNATSSWALKIRSYTQKGRFGDAVSLYAWANLSSVQRPDNFAVTAVLKASARVAAPLFGASVHAQLVRLGHGSDVYVMTALVDFYSRTQGIGVAGKVFDEMPTRNVVSWNTILAAHLKVGELDAARKVFEEMPCRDVVSWNSMISGYAKVGDMDRAVSLFWNMPEKNSASWNALVGGWISHGQVEFARHLFDRIPVKNDVSWVTMISGYARYGHVRSARTLFDQMEARELYSWNAMIACYAQNERPREALELFNRMRKLYIDGRLQPDEMTFTSVISACSQLGNLKFGSWVERYMSVIDIKLDERLGTAFVDLYAKCGSIRRAFEFFSTLKKPDVVSFSAMILGCGMNGEAFRAFELFGEMLKNDISPNTVTFTGLLASYRHAGLVEEGIQCFSSMWMKYQVAPTANHYAIMVDLLGRTGRLNEAYQLIRSMPMQPHVGAWGALLLASKLHGNVKLGEIAAQNCFQLEPKASGYYVLLASIYADAGKWDEAKRLRQVMNENGVSLTPGCSWVEPEP